VDDRWRRAALLGSLWAASEIVLGSFLHNLNVPLGGHVLTAIGIVLLVAGHRRWGRPGLLWRAGLIAAAMKAVSPSAVLLGPMVAIAMEGFVLELGSRLAPRRLPGYLLGGGLAMSWTMIHHLLSLLVTYGANIVTLYGQLVTFAEHELGALPFGAWGPIAALVAINFAAGATAAWVGWSVAATAERATEPVPPAPVPAARRAEAGSSSLPGLVVVVAAVPAGMVGLGELPLAGAAAVVAAVLVAAALRYPRSVRRLRRPSFWLGLTLLTAFAGLASAFSGAAVWPGVRLGVAMSLRALFIAVCFAALGVELANPVIRSWMAHLGAEPLLAALEAAFAALPEAIAALPPPGTLLRHPRMAVGALLPQLERWLARDAGQTG
jgi:hypothetical protein